MRWLKIAVLFFLVASTAVAQHSLHKVWETPPVLRFGEGPVLAPEGTFLYVSNTDGQPLEKDGKGEISKIGLDGKVIDLDWVTGMNAPKGMAEHKGLLYVADLDQLVVVDEVKKAIVKRTTIPGARLLHNVAVDASGKVYASDLFGGTVYRVEGDKVTPYLERLNGPAGLLFVGDDLLVYTADGLLRFNPAKQKTIVAQGLDSRANGIVAVDARNYILTSWGGFVYWVGSDGSKQTLLDTSSSHIAAGINVYDAKTNMMYMTTDEHNVLMAFCVE